jgi:hypothetical protein
MMSFSFIAAFPLFLGFLFSDGFWSVFFSGAASAVLLFTSPVNIVMAQRFIPRGASTVAALTMGFAWGTAGLLIPLVGSGIEHLGFEFTFVILALLTLPGFVLTLFLPADDVVGGEIGRAVGAESQAQ